MGRFTWRYIINIVLLLLLLTTTIACNEATLPGTVPPDVPEVSELPDVSELPELSDQPGILWIDPETGRPMLEVAENPDSLELQEPPSPPERIEELPSEEARGVLPIIRRFEAIPNIVSDARNAVRIFFDVPNADGISVCWYPYAGISDCYPLLTPSNWWSSGGYGRSVRHSSGEGLFFFFWVPSSWTSNITCYLYAQNSVGRSQASLTIYVGEQSATVKPIPSLEPAGSPTIHSFNADLKGIAAGGSSNLSWVVSNADFIDIASTGFLREGLPLKGSISVSPTSIKTYTLSATNATGTVGQVVTVTVKGTKPSAVPPTIHSFNADPGGIAAGGSSNLSWVVSNADFIDIAGTGFLREGLPLKGSISVSPTSIKTYTLSATNAAGTVGQVVTVTVEPEAPLPPPTKAKPDLVITDILRSGTTQWYYVIKNQGEVECSGSSSQLMIDGKAKLAQTIGPLEAGESREMYFSYKFACESGTPHTWSVVADVKSAIGESDEGNNSRKGKFTCSK